MPNHDHPLMASINPGTVFAPTNTTSLSRSVGGNAYDSSNATRVSMSDNSLQSAGGSQSHNNMQPYLTMSFIIALVGLYPSRS